MFYLPSRPRRLPPPLLEEPPLLEPELPLSRLGSALEGSLLGGGSFLGAGAERGASPPERSLPLRSSDERPLDAGAFPASPERVRVGVSARGGAVELPPLSPLLLLEGS